MKVLQGFFLGLLAVVLSIAALLTASAFKWAQELPDLSELDAYNYTATTQIFGRNGEFIGELVPVAGADKASTNRIPVALEGVSPAALAAIVASEDDQFFRHYGFDTPALLKATYLEFLGGGGRGGSGITFQVVKNTVLSDIQEDRTLERKFKELMLSVELERRLTKEEILQRYINVVYWGGNVYGIRQAAKAYFDKDPSQLSLAEGLYLARLLPAPSRVYEDFVDTRKGMRGVLDNMVAQGVVSRELAERAWLEPLQPTGWNVTYDAAGNIVGEPQRTGESIRIAESVSSELSKSISLAVRNELQELYGASVVFGSGGFKVYTTIDPSTQRAAMQASKDAEVPPGAQLAIAGLDPKTGNILAMVGEHLVEGQREVEYNRALNAWRQPGSSFKPIVYATALEQGGYTQASLVDDERTTFAQQNGPDWIPNNHDNTFSGFKTLRQHLDLSRNIPVIKLVEAVGPEAVTARARELGYDTVQPTLALALGSYEVTPLQHASALGSFANGGVHAQPHLIERIEDGEGNVIWEHKKRDTRVWSEATAYVMLDLMHGNVTDPGAYSRRAQIDGRWVAGKTGTTNDDKDIWFVGMTPGIVAAVWIGFDDASPIPKKIDPALTRAGDGTVGSSRQPIYVWKAFVEAALRGTPGSPDGYPVPPGVTFAKVSLDTGTLNASGVNAAFVEGTEPGRAQQLTATPITVTVAVDQRTNKRATAATPPDQVQYIDVSPDDLSGYLN